MSSFAQIVQLESSFRAFLAHYFGIKRHTKQLFLPWRRLYLESTAQSGVSYFNAVSFNFVSRLIGATVRINVVIFGCLLIVFNTIFWAGVMLVGWPILIIVDFWREKQKKYFSALCVPEYITNWSKNPEIKSVLDRAELSKPECELFWQTLTEFLQKTPLKNISFNYHQSLSTLATLISNQDLHKYPTGLALPWETLMEVVGWHWQTQSNQQTRSLFNPAKTKTQIRPIGADWGYGFTPNLDRFSRNLNEEAEKSTVSLNTRPELLREITDTFSKSSSAGILLIGQPGIGKFSLCMSLAKHISQKNTFPRLVDHRVMMLDLGQIVGITTDPATQALVLDKIFAEASAAGNIILVLDNLHQFISPLGLADFSHVFAKVNRIYKLKLIGLSTYDNFRQFITANPTVMTRFEIVYMNPTNSKETLSIIEQMVDTVEKQDVLITLPAIKELIEKSNQVLEHVPNPEKSINLLELCLGSAQSWPITKTDVGDILTKKMGIPLGKISNEDREKLTHLRELLGTKVVGQTEALDTLTAAVKRAQLALATREKTKGAFLFLGPTGVGKTETAKALAEVFFGSPQKLIRIDLGEYGQAESLANLIGSPQGSIAHSTGGLLTEAVRQQPYTTVLFDELEKAHPQILSALLTVLDEGYLTDARDQRISFRHTFVIATSNAGSELFYANAELTQHKDTNLQSVIDQLVAKKIFAPEFLNRFDGIVLFSPLSQKEIEEIVQRKLGQLKEKVFNEHKLRLTLSDALLNHIIKTAYNPQFGARHLERVLTKEVLDRVANQLINQPPPPNSNLNLDL